MASLFPIDSSDLVKGFHKSLEDNPRFRHLTYAQVSEASKALFSFVKKCMKNPDLPSVRLKGLGLFQVRVGKAVGSLREYLRGKTLGVNFVYPEVIDGRIDMLTKFIRKHAPEKLEEAEDLDFKTKQRAHGKSYSHSKEYESLADRQPEVPDLLQQKPPDPGPDEDPYSRANWFSHFFHGR